LRVTGPDKGGGADNNLVEDVYEILARASFEHLFQPGGRQLPGDGGLGNIHLSSPLRRDPRFVDLRANLGLASA
jgi:hypothetical protein